MKKLLMAFMILMFAHPSSALMVDKMQFGRFGTVVLYRESAQPANVVLFISGDGGWNKGVVDMAKSLSQMDTLVVGIDIIHYLRQMQAGREKCSYPAADFEMLSQFIQKKLQYKIYVPPVIVGYSSGATLAYALVAQAPTGTFLGALSLGFCPDIDLSKPLCHGKGLEATAGPKGKGYILSPDPNLKTSFVVLQGTIDQVCNAVETEEYVKKVGNTKIVMLPKVGHGFSVQANWLPQFKAAFVEIEKKQELLQAPHTQELADLPIAELPSPKPEGKTLAVIISGDGGWVGIDRDIGMYLSSKSIPVAGLDSLSYFWDRKTPEQAAKDLTRILNYYLSAWKKEEIILIGYSMGADVLPFMADRLPPELLDKVKLIVLLGPDDGIDFEFHVADLVDDVQRDTDLPVLPEVQKLKNKKIMCVYGQEESDSLCRKLDPRAIHIYEAPDGHHFGFTYDKITEDILETAK